MEKFAEHGSGKRDFDFRVGPAEGDWDCKAFGDRLWSDVAVILDVAPVVGGEGGSGGYSYWFENDDLSVSMFVDDPEPGWPLEKVPAMLTAVSRSDSVETWQLAEGLYGGLRALSSYLVIVFADDSMPIIANFDIGDDW